MHDPGFDAAHHHQVLFQFTTLFIYRYAYKGRGEKGRGREGGGGWSVDVC
jgi:hypothetical protein